MELLTVDEAAKLLRVAPITIRRHIAAGRLPAVKVGNRVRVRREAIDAFVKPLRPTATAPKKTRHRGKAFTKDDPLWDIVGLVTSVDGPGDVSENKHKYLAEAYLHRAE